MSDKTTVTVHGAQLSRRKFLRDSGALVVSLGLLPGCGSSSDNTAAETPATAETEDAKPGTTLDASQPTSWVEILADNTVTIRTGKCDFGQGSIYTAYPQIVAEELGVSFDAITRVVSGDTDTTPDGGGTFGLLRTNVLNLRKAAAYTREALLTVAGERFGVESSALSINDGVITGGGQSITLGELVSGQQLELTIPVSGELISFSGLVVAGDPPLKPAREYKIVGQSFENPIIAEKVSAKTTWVGNAKLPGMVHGRVVLPKTLGSKLVSAGRLPKTRFPTAQTVVVGNFLGVVADTEWEAIQASQAVASTTQWSDWQGLPGSEGLFDYLQNDADWDAVPANLGGKNTGDVASAKAANSISGSYKVPFQKHAPIGPSLALADVQTDGRVEVHTHTQNPQQLRRQIGLVLGTSTDNVVIRTYPGPGHYGRSNGGNAGAEDQAVLLSQAVGKPVRLQWMRPEDIQWSTQASPNYAEVTIGLDDNGKIQSYKADHYGLPMQDDRNLGALLSGKPTIQGPTPDNPERVQGMGNFMADGWTYGAVPNVLETAHSTWQLGFRESEQNIGLRNHSLRTPTQFQQNFPREVAISEAATVAGVDTLQFRIDNTDDRRVKRLLTILRDESQWDTRPSPQANASASGASEQIGRGVSLMFRGNGYWACACRIGVVPETGKVRVQEMVVAVDTGVVVNPTQLKRQVQAGALMGVSQALHEEVTFDTGTVTSRDWFSYPILTMAEMPNLKVVLAPDPETDIYGQGSEGANALVPSAIASAVFDATGKQIRQIPLKPEYVKAQLNA
ncbi:xanthine dehydrogenase family protein molybdopterin-binding subunit [Halioxenophilus aromaticivorans]|uniref:Xanthine dehydrogenase family protein molybdopterin-binding subunit n=1 Tax=Halioxenophilus aromaticivorans TaxID=1306992 RepID=A0AAV3U7A6_9ALTE